MGKDNTVVQEEKTSLRMCIFVPSTVMSSWEHVAAVSCSCLTDKELLAKQDIIAHWYYWTRLLISSFAGCKSFLCAWTHILFSSSCAWSHLRCTPMELLPASQYVFINGVRAWTYMEKWSSSTTSHHYSHSAWLSSLNNQVIVVHWLMIYLDLHFLVHDYHSLVAKYRHLCSWCHTVHGHILFG